MRKRFRVDESSWWNCYFVKLVSVFVKTETHTDAQLTPKYGNHCHFARHFIRRLSFLASLCIFSASSSLQSKQAVSHRSLLEPFCPGFVSLPTRAYSSILIHRHNVLRRQIHPQASHRYLHERYRYRSTTMCANGSHEGSAFRVG